MSNGKSTIFNCGATHCSAAIFNAVNGRLSLDTLSVATLNYDFSEESQWLDTLGDSLQHVISGAKLKGDGIIIAPGYQLLTKTLKVASVDKDRQSQLIAFEAGNTIPYPLSEVSWDYQIVGDDGVEAEVLLIFAKKEAIEPFCRVVSQHGVRPKAVQASTVLDINAYRYTYPGDQPATILINIGARSTNMLFIDNDGFYVRTINHGGNAITQSIADNLGISFGEAERVKIDFFSGQSNGLDAATANQLRSNAESFNKRLNQELTRSIVNYRRQRSAQAPERILLTGGGSQLDGITEFLAEKQQVAVSLFDPLEAVDIGSGVNNAIVDQYRYRLSEVVGQAVHAVEPESVSVNLLPENLADEMRFAGQKVLISIAAVCLALIAIPPYIFYSQANAAAEAELEALSGDLNPLRSRHEAILATTDDAKVVRHKISKLESLVASRSNWIALLANIQAGLQDTTHAWLESVEAARTADGRINLSGRLLIHDFDPDDPQSGFNKARDRLNELIAQFKKSPFVNNVTDVRIDTSNPRILGFQLTFVTNPERPM